MIQKRFRELNIGDVFEIGGVSVEVIRIGMDLEFRNFVWVKNLTTPSQRNFRLSLPDRFPIITQEVEST